MRGDDLDLGYIWNVQFVSGIYEAPVKLGASSVEIGHPFVLTGFEAAGCSQLRGSPAPKRRGQANARGFGSGDAGTQSGALEALVTLGQFYDSATSNGRGDTTSRRKAGVHSPLSLGRGAPGSRHCPKGCSKAGTHLLPPGPTWKQQRKSQAQRPSSSSLPRCFELLFQNRSRRDI